MGKAVGFSFVELLATLAIMSVLLMVAVPSAQLVAQRQRESELRAALATIREGIDRYKKAADQGKIALKLGASGYPPDLEALVEGVEDISSPKRRMLYILRKLPADPFHRDDASEPADTWGLRSYESPPDDPSEGDDVFDVYSLAEGEGLNGVPYRDW